MSVYRRRTGWKPQEERRFTVTDTRPEHIDRQGVVDLLLFMALSPPDATRDRLKARIAPVTRANAA